MKRRTQRPCGFTLIELLVVVAIIALLISILLPSLGQARRQARSAVCQTNMRSLAQAAITYVSEYGVFPPSVANYREAITAETRALRLVGGKDWLGVADQTGVYTPGNPDDPKTGNPQGFDAAPKFGLLFKTIQQEKAYLCPDDKPGPYADDNLLGGGGNGKFSYTMFAMLGMRAPEKVPPRPAERMSGPSRGPQGPTGFMPRPPMSQVPLFVEESPVTINTKFPPRIGSMEGNFNTNIDRVVSRHPTGSRRLGYALSGNTTSATEFYQESTNISFADGHVESVKVNFGFTESDIRPTTLQGKGLKGIPQTAQGLLYYYGLEFLETRDGVTTLVRPN